MSPGAAQRRLRKDAILEKKLKALQDCLVVPSYTSRSLFRSRVNAVINASMAPALKSSQKNVYSFSHVIDLAISCVDSRTLPDTEFLSIARLISSAMQIMRKNPGLHSALHFNYLYCLTKTTNYSEDFNAQILEKFAEGSVDVLTGPWAKTSDQRLLQIAAIARYALAVHYCVEVYLAPASSLLKARFALSKIADSGEATPELFHILGTVTDLAISFGVAPRSWQWESLRQTSELLANTSPLHPYYVTRAANLALRQVAASRIKGDNRALLESALMHSKQAVQLLPDTHQGYDFVIRSRFDVIIASLEGGVGTEADLGEAARYFEDFSSLMPDPRGFYAYESENSIRHIRLLALELTTAIPERRDAIIEHIIGLLQVIDRVCNYGPFTRVSRNTFLAKLGSIIPGLINSFCSIDRPLEAILATELSLGKLDVIAPPPGGDSQVDDAWTNFLELQGRHHISPEDYTKLKNASDSLINAAFRGLHPLEIARNNLAAARDQRRIGDLLSTMLYLCPLTKQGWGVIFGDGECAAVALPGFTVSTAAKCRGLVDQGKMLDAAALMHEVVWQHLMTIEALRDLDHLKVVLLGEAANLPVNLAGSPDVGWVTDSIRIVRSSRRSRNLNQFSGLGVPLTVAISVGQDLSLAGHEVSLVHSRFPSAILLINAHATRQRCLNEIENATRLHFAGHGTYASETGSALRVWDGVISSDDLLTLSPHSRDFAVLSACNSGGIAGFLPDQAISAATALLCIGFQSVLASSWPVRDVLSFVVGAIALETAPQDLPALDLGKHLRGLTVQDAVSLIRRNLPVGSEEIVSALSEHLPRNPRAKPFDTPADWAAFCIISS